MKNYFKDYPQIKQASITKVMSYLMYHKILIHDLPTANSKKHYYQFRNTGITQISLNDQIS
jgi:hypothetical protein